MKAQKIILWGDPELDRTHRVIDGLEKDPNRPWQVTIKRFYESPSERQRGYYRDVMLPAICKHVAECGFGTYSDGELHEWLKKKFGQAARVEIDGEAYEVIDFTTSDKGDIAAMSAYMDKILNWAAGDLGLYIPPPKKKWEREQAA